MTPYSVRTMLRRFSQSTVLVLVAAANICGAEPAARPLNVVRPIFALPATARPGTTGYVRNSAPMPHRQPVALVPDKTVEAPKSSTAANPAPPPRYGISTIPHHRRSLGW